MLKYELFAKLVNQDI